MQRQALETPAPCTRSYDSICNRINGTLRFLLYRLFIFLYRGKMGTGVAFRGVVYG